MYKSLTGILWELTMQGGCCKELKMWIWSKFSSILMRIRECSWPPQVILLPLLSLYYYLLPTMIPSHVEYKQRKTSHAIFLKSQIFWAFDRLNCQMENVFKLYQACRFYFDPYLLQIYISFGRKSKNFLKIVQSADYRISAYYSKPV